VDGTFRNLSVQVTDGTGATAQLALFELVVSPAPVALAAAAPDLSVVRDAFRDATGAFLARRADRVLSSEPKSYRMDRRKDASVVRSFSADASDTEASASLSILQQVAESRWYTWVEGSYEAYNDKSGSLSERDGQFGVFYLGVDYRVSDSVAVGALFQFDHTSEEIGSFSDISGTGWMAGPYVSAELGAGLYFDARAAWGTSSNDAEVDVFENGDLFKGDFSTERFLARAALSGEFEAGPLLMLPRADLAFMRDEQSDYSVSNGLFSTQVSGVRAELGRLTASNEFDLLISDAPDEFAVLYATPGVTWNFHSDDASGDIESVRGSIEVGMRYGLGGGLRSELSVRYDGIGAAEFGGIAASAAIRLEF